MLSMYHALTDTEAQSRTFLKEKTARLDVSPDGVQRYLGLALDEPLSSRTGTNEHSNRRCLTMRFVHVLPASKADSSTCLPVVHHRSKAVSREDKVLVDSHLPC